jgi:threonine synthase
MSYMKALKCRECGKEYPKEALHVCELCFGPLEVSYEYDKIKEVLSRAVIEKRPPNMWRYRELLPLEKEPSVGGQVGFTPLVRARNLAEALGVREIS